MSIFCDCEDAEGAISDIPISDCPENFGQIQRFLLQKEYATAGNKNAIVDPTLMASWSPLLTASDNTKVVQTPFISAPTNEAGAKKEYGGGNETPNGIPIPIGSEPGSFTASILRAPQSTIAALKTYQCKSVGAWFVNEHGQIGCLTDDPENPTEYYPVPMEALFIGDKVFGGFDGVDMNAIEFMLRPNWSDKWVVITPADFNPLDDLATS